MSQSDDADEERPSREVAWRLFAAEFDDADYQYAESDEERAPNYVVTPTGARVNRLFAVGVLTSVEQVNEDVVRARVVDPTGAFVVYAGQYQPDALASLENADVPSFVAVTGKARTFSPDDSEQVYTSIRPESVNAVTPETRDRWVVSTAERTLSRIATFADALDMPERGDDLTDALVERGAPYGLASGISHAIDHYGTTPAYLAAVRELALDATRVVAGDLDEVEDLALAPDEGDGTDADLSYPDAALADAEPADTSGNAAMPDEHVEATADGETVTTDTEPSPDDFEESESATEPAEAESTESEAAESTESEAAESTESEAAESEAEAQADSVSESEADSGEETESVSESEIGETEEPATTRTEATPEGETATTSTEPSPDDFESEEASSEAEPASDDAEPVDEGEASDEDEQWEMDEETRAEVEEEFDVGFSTGGEIPEGGEEDRSPDDLEAGADEPASTRPSPDDEPADEGDGDLGDFETSASFEGDDDEADDLDDFTEAAYDEPESAAEDAESAPADVDLEDLVVDYMDVLNDGDGADRDELVRTVMEETDADEDEIGDAIQSALMSGRCYESGEDNLKAI